MKQNFYQFEAKSIQGKEISMENYSGKSILVVNTASKCGLTPQFEGLEDLYRKYSDKGFVILGFPCNQFANQELRFGFHLLGNQMMLFCGFLN